MSGWRDEMIRALSESGDAYLNGAELADRLGCTRSAVWKRMNKLRTEGYPIRAVTHRGYRLESVCGRFSEQITEELIKTGVDTDGLFIRVDEVSESTNASAKEAAESGFPEIGVFVTLFQRKGRGRRGRTWISTPGKDLCFSVLIRPSIPAESSGMLSLLFGWVVYQAFCEMGCDKTGIKWPNDIVSTVNGKKLCGILAETSFEDNRLSYAVIGCGINVSNVEFPEEIRETATSLFLEGAVKPSAPKLLASVIRNFRTAYRSFVTDPAFFLEDYRRNCVTLGREVEIIGETSRFARAKTINEKGELIVIMKDGSEAVVSAGEVSIRGIGGYL